MNTGLQMVYVAKISEVRFGRSQVSGSALYICSNRKIFDACRAMGLDALLLTENMLEGAEAELNEWSYRVAIDLIKRLKRQNQGTSRIFLDANFYPIKGVLLQGGKFLVTIESLIREYNPSIISYHCSSESLFIEFLRRYLPLFHPNISVVEFAGLKDPAAVRQWPDLIGGVRFAMRFVLNLQSLFVLAFRSFQIKKTLLVSGGLNHLRNVVLNICEGGKTKIVFVEEEFNYEKYLFCSKKLIPYFVVISGKNSGGAPGCCDNLLGEECIIFRNHDLSSVFAGLFCAAHHSGIILHLEGCNHIASFFSFVNPDGVLLDEDYSVVRRCLAALAWQNSIESFVTSHGVPAPPMSENAVIEEYCDSSEVLINSEFEKQAYEKIFFDPQRLKVLGTPRFDEIFALKKSDAGENEKSAARKKIVLLCLSTLQDYDYESFMPWIVGADSVGLRNRQYLKDLIAVLALRNDVLVKIKPHYVGEAQMIRDCVDGLGAKTELCVESHHANVFKLEHEADLIVTPESTIISEAMMLSKPVIVMCDDYRDPVLSWNKSGLVYYAHDQAELRKMVFLILDHSNSANDLDFCKKEKDISYYVRYSDGRNSERAAQYILKQMGVP